MSAYLSTLSRVSTLAERMIETMRLRGLNPSSWATKAGVGRETVRLTIDNGRDSAETKTLIPLARAANVSFAWLAAGEGEPEPASTETPDRYPSRAIALRAANLVGWSEAMAIVASVDHLPSDPGLDYWMALLRAKNLEHAQLAPQGAGRPKQRSR